MLKFRGLEFPLEVYFAVDAGAALAIDIAAEGEAYVEAIRSLKDDACSDAHAVATIGFDIVFNGGAGEVRQLIVGATVITKELVIPCHAGVSLPLSAVVAIQRLRIGDQTIAQLGAQGVIGCAFQIGADSTAVLVYTGTMSKAVVQCREGTALHSAVFLGQGCADIEAATVTGPVAISGAKVATATIAWDENCAMAAHLLHADTGAAEYGPTIPIGRSIAGVGTQIDALALDAAAAVFGGLMINSCMIAMGKTIGEGTLHSTDNAAIVIGVAIAAVMLVSVGAEGYYNVAPAVILRRFVPCRSKTSGPASNRNIKAKAA